MGQVRAGPWPTHYRRAPGMSPRCPRTAINSQRSPPAATYEPEAGAGFEPASTAREHAGNAQVNMQVFLEEAHNLLNRDKFNKATGDKDPYVRLARESAKFKIGLVYATQEVSAVDESILSNTANWVAAYMNNANEVKKLTQYYDFDAFGEQILTADDKGFIRLRTASCPFTLPVQVRKFDLDLVNGTRAELGRSPVDPSDNFAPGDVADGDDVSDVVDPDVIYDSPDGSPDLPSPTENTLDF